MCMGRWRGIGLSRIHIDAVSQAARLAIVQERAESGQTPQQNDVLADLKGVVVVKCMLCSDSTIHSENPRGGSGSSCSSWVREFGSNQGKLAKIVRALYGLCSSGKMFLEHFLAKTLHEELLFVLRNADPDVWMRKVMVQCKTPFFRRE